MIDINCDVGEGMDNEELLFPYISSCNIACGGHAGDETSIKKVLSLAKEHDVKIGAHPSYPDKENFGRVSMELSPSELAIRLIDQISTVEKLALNVGLELNHIKAHGALYNDLFASESLARAYLEALAPYRDMAKLYLPFGSVIARIAADQGFSVVHEAFADRSYEDDLSLTPRASTGAVITASEEVIQQVARIENEQKVLTVSGKLQELQASTYCVHSDTENAVDIVRALSEYFNKSFEPVMTAFGENSFLVEWPAKMNEEILDDMLAYQDKLEHFFSNGEYEFVQSIHSILITRTPTSIFEQPTINETEVLFQLHELYKKDNPFGKKEQYVYYVPVCYSEDYGADLSLVSESNSISIPELIRIHTQKAYRVYAVGFLPGFLYLGGLNELLHIDRKSKPRLKVPKGAVGIGGSQTGIYPQESPGGWQLIGRTPLPLFAPDSSDPCFARPGDKIKFNPISTEEYQDIEKQIADGTYLIEKEVFND